MKKSISLIAAIFIVAAAFAQKKTTTSAVIAFDASTAIDNLPKAVNKTAIGAVDIRTGTVQFEAAVKNFAFTNPRIQEHFNGKNWLNSDEFPKFSFSGSIENVKKINFKKNGVYTVQVSGNLTIRDVTKPLTTPATITVNGSTLTATTEFSIVLADFGISGVPIDAGKVAREPKITVSAELN